MSNRHVFAVVAALVFLAVVVVGMVAESEPTRLGPYPSPDRGDAVVVEP